MSQLVPNITDSGIAAIIKAHDGIGLKFTKIVLGNGDQSDDEYNLNDLNNPILEIGITEIEKHENFVIVSGEFDNNDLASGFYMTELGIFAKNVIASDEEGEEGKEILYAYRYADEKVQYIPSANSGNVMEMKLGVVVSIGNAENVTAMLSDSAVYASKADLNDHIKNDRNPHNVTAKDVGLENVENVHFLDNKIDYTEEKKLTNLVKGETSKKVFGKIYKLISDFSEHLKANNPHGITISTLRAASENHKHSAIDITSGILGYARGGTNATSKAGILSNLGLSFLEVSDYSLMSLSGHIKFTQGLLIQWFRDECEVDKGGIGEIATNWNVAYKYAPQVWVTENTTVPDKRWATVSSVTASGCCIYLNNLGAKAKNYVYVLAIGRWK